MADLFKAIGDIIRPFTNDGKCEVCGKESDDLYECEKCLKMICHDCQAAYNQFTQIDFNCCKLCAETNPE